MADKEVKVRVTTEADTSGLEDIENSLNNLEDKTITIRPEIQSMELEEIENRIEELEDKRADIYLGVDDTPLEEVEAELEELEARRLELTVAADSSGVDTVTSSVEGLESEIESINNSSIGPQADTSGVDDMAGGLEGVEFSADNAASALESMAGLQIGETLAQWGAQAEGFAQNLDNMAISTEQLAIQTGMTDSQMTGMLNNITNATFPRDEALMYVQSLDQIGVSAQNLGSSATGLDKINDAFHMGAPAVNKLGQELSVLGVDMNNVSSSYNALAYANANTVGGMENFSKFLTRFDADFNQLGLNVDQAAVAIAGATHKFGGGRAALSGMSSALKECNGDLGQLEQALGLEAGALQNASNLTAKYNGQLDQMAGKEAQHKTLTQQLAAALDDITASFTGALAPFASFLGLMGQFGGAAVSANALLTLPGNIKEATSALKGLNLATKAYSAAEAIANGVRAAAAAAQNALNLSMLSNPILLLVAALAILIGYMIYLYQTNEQCRNSVNKLGEDLTRVASGDYSKLRDVGNDLMAASDSFAQASGFAALIGEDNYNRWVELRNGMLQAFGDMLGGAGEQLMLFGGQVGTIFQQAGMSVQGFINWIVQGFMQGINSLQSFGMNLLQLPNYIMQAVTQGIATFQTLISQTSSVLNSVIGAVVGFGGNLIGQLSGAASSAVSAFGSGLSGMVAEAWAEFNDVLNAIYDFGAQAVSAAQNIGNQITQALFQRHSPGIVAQEAFLEMRDTKRFMEEGFSDMVGITQVASSNIVNGFNPDLNSNIGNIGGNNGTQALGGGVTMNIVINGDVDSEERMERFADYIINRMTFSNDTAGRTV